MKFRITVILCSITLVTISCANRKQENPIVQIHEVADTAINNDVFSTFLKQSRENNKNLFMLFGFESCGWCRLFEKYHNDPSVKAILDKYFIMAIIDYDKTHGGKELYKNYGSTGFPSWTIIDTAGQVLLNSNAPVPGVMNKRSNIGYPYGNDEMKYYLYALKTAAPEIKDQECELLAEKLKFYREHQ